MTAMAAQNLIQHQAQEQQVPDGFMLDAKGRQVPVNLVSDYDKAKDQLVKEVVAGALEVRAQLQAFKVQAMGDVDALVQLAMEKYKAPKKPGGDKGNVTLYSYDGRFKVARSIGQFVQVGEQIHAAKSIIDSLLNEWTEGSRDELKRLVMDAFQVNQEGHFNIGRLMELRRLEIHDERWQQAMVAISDAVQVVATKSYLRIYERDANGKYQPITLDIAK